VEEPGCAHPPPSRDGITSGCGGGNYCPDQPVTRGEMAVFLATAFHLPLP
jgi:hypothetical protein